MKSYYKGRQVREYFSTKTILERAEMYYENLTKLLSIDFDNPDDGLKEFAIKNNLDLKDDSFKNIMHKYKINYLDKVNNFYEETVCFNDDSDSQSNLDGMEYDNYEQAEEDEDSALEKKKKKQKSKNKKTKKKTFKEASTNEDDEGFAKQESSCNYKDDDTEIIKIKKNIIKKKLVKSSDTIGKKVTKQNVFLQLFYIIISLTMLCLSLMFLCIYYDVN